jgi:hypothetical protein
VGGPSPYIVHVEFLSGRDLGLPARAFWYHVLLARQYHVPVRTVIVLLRPAADGPELTGLFEQSFPGRGLNLSFRYDVIRIWLEPPERLLTGGLSLLPLAPVSNVAPEKLEAVVTEVAERLKREADPELMKMLWSATTVLITLRHRREQVKALIERVREMISGIPGIEDSWLYQDGLAKGLAEGAVEEARNVLLRLGRRKFGEPDEHGLSQIAELDDLDRLNLLIDGLQDAESWDHLLTRPNT